MVQNTRLSFDLIPSYSSKTIVLVDTSYYNPNMIITGNSLQVSIPGKREIAELNYNQSGVIILNSSILGISPGVFIDLVDGVYTTKISICPYDQYWFEKTWYRTELIECKYSRAILKLDISGCRAGVSPALLRKLTKARMFIDGTTANMIDNNIKSATDCYNIANELLDEVLNCKCKDSNVYQEQC